MLLMRTVPAAGVVLVVFLLHATAASACSCLPPGPPSTELNRSAAVFAGTVTEIREDATGAVPGSGEALSVTFDVQKVWKGRNTSQVTVRTARSTAACGHPFEEGRAYLVYADGRNDSSGLTVSLCSRTAGLEHAEEDVDALGPAAVPGNGSGDAGGDRRGGEPLLGFGAGLFLAMIVPPLLALLTLIVLVQLVTRRGGQGIAVTGALTTLGGLVGVYTVLSNPNMMVLLTEDPIVSIILIAPLPVGIAALARWHGQRTAAA